MTEILVSKIQTFCLHDGPGIRTTVFLKGCSLSCPWCSNPENISPENEYWPDEKTGEYVPVAQHCTPEELFAKLTEGSAFWRDGGGVTFSGGEALLQIEALEPLLKMLKGNGVDICFETALHVPAESVALMLRYADRLYADMKDIRGNPAVYLNNLGMLDKSGIPYTIRIPLVKPFTCNEENLELIENELKKHNQQKVEVFKAHTLAEKKYEKLGKPFVAYDNVTNEELEEFAKRIGADVLKIG